MALSAQAYLTFIASIILFIALLIPSTIKVYDPETKVSTMVPYNVSNRLFLVFIISIPLAIHIYSINCLTAGKCNIFAWVVSVMIVTWIISFLFLAFSK